MEWRGFNTKTRSVFQNDVLPIFIRDDIASCGLSLEKENSWILDFGLKGSNATFFKFFKAL
jgi:hypothetical protein